MKKKKYLEFDLGDGFYLIPIVEIDTEKIFRYHQDGESTTFKCLLLTENQVKKRRQEYEQSNN